MKTGLCNNNKGYSLVEIIVIIAIISILTGTIGFGLSFSSGKPATECAQKLSQELQHIRTTTMGKQMIIVTITRDSEDRIVVIQDVYTEGSPVQTSQQIVGKRGVEISYLLNGTATEVEITSAAPISFEFSRSTGALKPISGTSDYYSKFKISKSGTTQYVNIVPLTGRISVDS